jgi:hypothetical protein
MSVLFVRTIVTTLQIASMQSVHLIARVKLDMRVLVPAAPMSMNVSLDSTTAIYFPLPATTHPAHLHALAL